MSKECRRSSRSCILLLILLTAALIATGCSNPERAKAEHVQRGETFLKDKKYQEASIEFRNALQIDDKLAAAHWGLAQAFEGLQRVPETMEELRRTVDLDPNNLAARTKLGNYYLVAAKTDPKNRSDLISKADRLAGEVLERDANNIEGYILRGSVFYARGERDKALADLNHAIALDPKRIESQLSLARFYIQEGDTDKAEEIFRHALSLNNQSVLVHTEYGRFLSRLNRLDAAEVEFKKAIEIEPTNFDSRRVLAEFYRYVVKQNDKAEAAYKALAELDQGRPDGRALLADFYSSVGRYDEAIKTYQDLAVKVPEYTNGKIRLGEILLQRGDTAGAMAQADEILKKNKGDLQALLLRSRISLQSGKVNDSIEDLREVLKQEPHHQLGLYFMAEANYRAGQIDQARIYAGDLDRFYPNYLPGKLWQVQINLAMGDAKTAQRLATELLNSLTKITPDALASPQMLDEIRSGALTARGTANLQLKDLKAARADYEAARNINPNAPAPYINIASVALAEGKTDEAVQHYERALAIDRTNFDALSGLVNIYANQNRLDQAHARVDQALNAPNAGSFSNEQRASLHYLKAQVYGYQKDSQGAETELRRALESDRNYMPAFSALGALYVNIKQLDRAIEEYRKIAEQRPDDATPHILIGMIEDGRGNYDKAVESYRRALTIKPDSVIAANNLAWIYAEYGKGNLDEAIRLAQGTIQKFPDEPGFADTLGWVYYKKGLPVAAVEQLEKAVARAAAKNDDNALYRYHLGVALASSGNKAGARQQLQQALRLAEGKDFDKADEARKALATL